MCRIIKILFIPILLLGTKYAGEFQELQVGARACAMGGTGIAQFVDPTVIYFNPAGSFFTMGGLHIMHAENFAGIVKNDFGAVILPKGNMSFGAGIQYVSVSGIKLTTLPDTTLPPGNENQPLPYDTVGTSDFLVYINGAKGNEKIALGANIKIFYRNLNVLTGYGGGLDLGIAVNLDYLKFGIVVRDFILSPLIWNNGSKETILPKISLGIAPSISLEKIHSAIMIEADFVKHLDINGFTVNLGFEYAYKNLIFGRAGIYNGEYTFGIGLRYKKFSLDYALVQHSELKNSNKFSAGLQF